MKPIQSITTLCPLPSPLTMCRKRKNFQFHCSRRTAAEDRNGGGGGA